MAALRDPDSRPRALSGLPAQSSRLNRGHSMNDARLERQEHDESAIRRDLVSLIGVSLSRLVNVRL